MYRIYNPSTVSFEDFDDMQLAIARRDELRLAVESMFPYPVEVLPPQCFMLEDWRVAEEFFSQKTGVSGIDFSDADCVVRGGNGNTTYSHSVFNASTNEYWSRTFAYMLYDSLFHIKVRNGEVTDWYQYKGVFDGVVREWVAFDLVSGQPIEYYDFEDPVQTKHVIAEPEQPVTTIFSTPPDELVGRLPDAVKSGQIFAYASKSYGDIVEYRESIESESIPSTLESATEKRIAELRLLVDEHRSQTRSQIVALEVVENSDGTTTVTNIDGTL